MVKKTRRTKEHLIYRNSEERLVQKVADSELYPLFSSRSFVFSELRDRGSIL